MALALLLIFLIPLALILLRKHSTLPPRPESLRQSIENAKESPNTEGLISLAQALGRSTCPEEEVGVSVRRLPVGDSHWGQEAGRNGRQIRIELAEACGDFRDASLVEITSNQTVFLGTVQTYDEKHLTVLVKHAVDRDNVAAIQARWTRAPIHHDSTPEISPTRRPVI